MARSELVSSKLAPDQVFVTCNYCSQNIAQETRNEDRDGRLLTTASNGISLARQKVKTQVSNSNYIMKHVHYALTNIIALPQINCCRSCRKPLPRCAICLLNLGTPIDSVRDAMESAGLVPASVDRPFGFDLWFTWCQTCRHGGHAIHMLQWFESHKQCPVSDCSCMCSMQCKSHSIDRIISTLLCDCRMLSSWTRKIDYG